MFPEAAALRRFVQKGKSSGNWTAARVGCDVCAGPRRCRPTTRRRGQGVHSAGIILGRIQCNCEYSQAEVVGSDDGRLFCHHDVNVFEPSR